MHHQTQKDVQAGRMEFRVWTGVVVPLQPELQVKCSPRSRGWHLLTIFYQGSLSEDQELIALLDKLHLRSYWLTKRQDASEKIKSIKADIERLDVGVPGHASQSEVFKAHLRVYDPIFKKANERLREVNQELLAAHRQGVLNLLQKSDIVQPPAKTIADASPSNASNVEQRLEALERGYRKDIDELRKGLAKQQESLKSYEETNQSLRSQIRIIETKLGAESSRSTTQESKIRGLEEKLLQADQKLTRTDEKLNNLSKQLEENRKPTASGYAQGNVPNELKSQIENLQGLAKNQEKKSKDMEFELARQKEHYKTVSAWKENLQKGQRTFATKEDIRTLNARQQTDVTKLASQIESTTASVNKLWELESKKTQTPSADQAVTQDYLARSLARVDEQLELLRTGLSKIVENEIQARIEKVEKLLPRLELLENTTLKSESLGDIKVEDLQAICKRDFDASIREEVERRIVALPISSTQEKATTLQPQAGNQGVIAATVKLEIKEELKRDMQPTLSKMSEGVGAFIDAEREERKRIQLAQDILREDLEKLVSQLHEAQKMVRQQSGQDDQSKTIFDEKLQEIRERAMHDKSMLASQILDLQEQRKVATTEHHSVLERLSALGGAINSMHKSFSDRLQELYQSLGTLTTRHDFDLQFGELRHEISCLNAFQAHFSTKDIYNHMVRYMQDLVPNGTHAALKNFDIRLYNLERSVAVEGASRELPTPVSAIVPSQHHMTNGFAQQPAQQA